MGFYIFDRNKQLNATNEKKNYFYGFMKQKQDKQDATETNKTFYRFYMIMQNKTK